MPERFIHDGGGEFNNPQVIDIAEKYGLPLNNITAGYAPYSDGICEQNYVVIDKMMAKLMSTNPTLTEQNALDNALYTHNMENNNKRSRRFCNTLMVIARRVIYTLYYKEDQIIKNNIIEFEMVKNIKLVLTLGRNMLCSLTKSYDCVIFLL